MSDSADEKVTEPKVPTEETTPKQELSELTTNLDDVKLETSQFISLRNNSNRINYLFKCIMCFDRRT